MIRRPPSSTLFPSPPLSRSGRVWIGGILVSLAVLLVGLSRLSWIAGHSVALTEGAWWTATADERRDRDRKSTRLNSSHRQISYAVFCFEKKKRNLWLCIVRV